MVAVEAHQGNSWNTFIFLHRDTRNRLYSLTQEIKLWPFLAKFMNSKWHHKFAKHNMMPQYVYQSVFKIFISSFFSSPAHSFWPIFCGVAWPPFISIGSLKFFSWLSGSLDHLLCACSWLSGFRSTCCLLDLSAWFWFPGFPSQRCGGVIPAGTLLGLCFCKLSSFFICLLFYLRPHAMLLVLQIVGDRSVFLQGCYWGRRHY